MLSFPCRGRVFLATAPADLRRSIDGLAGLVRSEFQDDPLSGDLFAFANRRRDRLKILLWECSGFWVLYKRLEKGTFAWPKGLLAKEEMPLADFSLLLEGIEVGAVRRRKWYKRSDSENMLWPHGDFS